MKNPVGRKSGDTGCSIEAMETLLNQIADFKSLVKTTHDSTDPRFIQECKLFRQYVKWVSEDLTAESYICSTSIN